MLHVEVDMGSAIARAQGQFHGQDPLEIPTPVVLQLRRAGVTRQHDTIEVITNEPPPTRVRGPRYHTPS